MRHRQEAKTDSGAALVRALATTATAATQVARVAKATETSVTATMRARDRMVENRRLLAWLLLGVLGLGIIFGIVMAKRGKRAGEPDESAVASGQLEAVPETESTGPTDSTEASG